MATSRWKTTELVRTLNAAPNPIYILDDQFHVVFLNRACREWLGPAAERLVGRRCAYHSTGEPSLASDEGIQLDALAALLCPPPTVLEGRPVGGWVGSLTPSATPSPITPSPMMPSPGVASSSVGSPSVASPSMPGPSAPRGNEPPGAAPAAEPARVEKPTPAADTPSALPATDASLPVARRRAWFTPVGPEGDRPVAIVAWVAAAAGPAVGDSGPSDRSAPSAARGGRTCLPDDEPSAEQLHEAIRRFRHEAAGRFRADRLIGTSVAARRVRRQIELAVAGRASVLLVGPPGSGRRHVASAIHYGSDPRRTGALVPLDCSVLGPELLVPTIYALTHGRTAGQGSGPGSLLLTDADRIPLEVQESLAAEILGRPFPWRLLATAGRPLLDLARRGHYHEELAAALSTLTIELPRLADRREDIPLLAQLFLEDNNARGAKQLAGLTPEALDLLCAYDWPGNLDELADAIAQAHQRAAGSEIAPADLPERLHLAAQAALRPRRGEETIVLDEFLGRMERELIRRAIVRAKGNKAKAARLLGLSRPRLYRRMVRLGLEPPGEGGGDVGQ